MQKRISILTMFFISNSLLLSGACDIQEFESSDRVLSPLGENAEQKGERSMFFVGSGRIRDCRNYAYTEPDPNVLAIKLGCPSGYVVSGGCAIDHNHVDQSGAEIRASHPYEGGSSTNLPDDHDAPNKVASGGNGWSCRRNEPGGAFHANVLCCQSSAIGPH